MKDTEKNILDLDKLSSPEKQIKLEGKVYPLGEATINQLIELSSLPATLSEMDNPKEMKKYVRGLLGKIIPALVEDPKLDFTLGQLVAIVNFIQSDTE